MKRDIKLDNFKGILIYLVVLAHLLYSTRLFTPAGTMFFVKIIYFFHMPLFLIISGYFSKKVDNKNLFKLFSLFILINFSYILFDLFKDNTFDLYTVKYSAWYILAIFLYRLLLKSKIFKKFFDSKYSLLIIFIISFLGSFINFYLIKLLTFAFYFFLGYKLDLKKLKKPILKCQIGLLSIFLLITILIIFVPFDLNFLMGAYIDSYNLIILRFITYLINILLFVIIYNLIPNKKITYIYNWGYNSLSIYTFHRIFTLIICDLLVSTPIHLPVSLVVSFLLCLLFSSKYITKFLNKILNYIYKYKIVFILLVTSLFLILSIDNIKDIIFKKTSYVSYEENEEIKNSVSLGFVGDLILLENQVKDYYLDDEFHFDYLFQNTKKYFTDTDFMMGVLEGPVDDSKNYSVGNFDDGKILRLNYPTSFLESIKKSGIDLVTISNNHILDNDLSSYQNTISNLEKINLDYVGKHKQSKIINVQGISIGVLAYTYGLNYISEDDLFSKYPNVTNYLVDKKSKYFKTVKQSVQNDFANLKKQNVDLIVVLPHYGTQFENQPDDFQKTWNEIFVNNGADIIFGCHTHSVQPVEYKNDTIIFNSVGNFVNSYIEHDGDISYMAKVYINKNTKKVINGSVIPLIALKDKTYGYFSIPIYEAVNNKDYQNITDKLEYANKLVTSIALHKKINLNDLEQEYWYFKDGYKKQIKTDFTLTEKDKKSLIYQKIEVNNNICFIGDSITEGSKNGFKPWYLPLMNFFPNKKVFSIAKGSYTTTDLLKKFKTQMAKTPCDLSIIDIGTNDIRYNLKSSTDYIQNIQKIVNTLNSKEVILLSPFKPISDSDIGLKKNKKAKKELYFKYNLELEKYAQSKENIYYIDPNIYIEKILKVEDKENFFVDSIHPNSGYGITLYSYATMR